MKEKGDTCILVGYLTQSKGYQVYNKRTRMIVESIHIRFDEIKEVSETSVANNTLGLVPQRQKASDYDNPDPPMFDEYIKPPRAERPVLPAQAVQAPINSAGTPSSTTIDRDAPSPSISLSSSALQSHSLNQGVAAEPNYMEDHHCSH
nr:retrovirus-related Pol polyprotein from transposon TNT 1-94 [Tanacetum cinerariifolium]